MSATVPTIDSCLHPSTPNLPTADYTAIYGLFEHAISHRLKYPKITLQAADGGIVILKVAGGKSKYQGQIQILSDGQYGFDQLYYGRIDEVGTLYASQDMNQHVRDLLSALTTDPRKVAFEHGKATGACCFCNLPLTDPRSTNHGYGPVCARHYGLPWDADRKNGGFQEDVLADCQLAGGIR